MQGVEARVVACSASMGSRASASLASDQKAS